MTDKILEELNRHFEQCTALIRDTTLDEGILPKYKIGLFLREPTFCDATHKIAGFVAPNRFLLISSNAKCLDDFTPNPWGLCLWVSGRIFKVIDRISDSGLIQITLLEIPDQFLEWFCNDELNSLERSFVEQARQTFESCRRMPPLPELNTQAWRDRLTYPVGINDHGAYFPLFSNENSGGNTPRTIARVMHHQGKVQLMSGDYVEANHALHQAIQSSRGSNEYGMHGSILLTLSDLQVALDDLPQAETNLLEAFESFKKLPHDENREAVAATHLRLGHLYQFMGAKLEAEENYLHALRILRRILKDEKSLVPLLSSLGALYEGNKQWDEAHKYLDEALEISRKTGTECKDSVLLNNLGRLAQAEGDYNTAIDYLQRALAVERNAARQDPEHHTTLIHNIAECFAASGNEQRAFEFFQLGLSLDRDAIARVALVASDRQRQAFVLSRQFRIHQCISLILTRLTDSAEARECAVRLILERKGLALDLNVIHREMLFRGSNENDAVRLKELAELRLRINLWAFAGRRSSRIEGDRLEMERELKQCEQIESELATRLASVELERRLRSYTWRNVAAKLSPETILLEYFQLRRFEFGDKGQSSLPPQRVYLAIALTQASDYPVIVELGDAIEIDRQISRLRSALTGEREIGSPNATRSEGQTTRHLTASPQEPAGISAFARQLERLLIEPFAGTLRNKRRIIVAPDGNLCRLPFEVLLASDGSALIDRFDVRYVTGAYDLLRPTARSTSEASRPLVIADPDFNLTKAEASTGTDQAEDAPFTRLPGAREEGETIARMLGVKAITGKHAVESVVKNAHSPSVLHLASHGFVLEYSSKYLSPDEIKEGMVITSDFPIIAVRGADPAGQQDDSKDEGETYLAVTPPKMLSGDEDQAFSRLSGRGIENPMLRCGLALAGANTWLRGGSLPEESEDGILTAEELSGLDLANTQLVVLSACETGLGDVLGGEGVFGLRRSFVLSGAASLVMSLWKVPDVQTKELMVDFYTRLLGGESPSVALRQSKLSLKQRYPLPYFWGAFVYQGV